MSTESEARAAIAELDGYNLNGSRIHVEVCTCEWIDWLWLLLLWLLRLRLQLLIVAHRDVSDVTLTAQATAMDYIRRQTVCSSLLII